MMAMVRVLVFFQPWARDDLRSLNAQIEFALRLSLEKAGRKLAEPPDLKNERTSQENGI